MQQKPRFRALIIRLLICFFILSVSVSVIPSNSIGVFGFFGEITAEAVQSTNVEVVKEDHKLKAIQSQVSDNEKQQQQRILELHKLALEWFLFLALFCIVINAVYTYALPNAWNLISYKIRLDD
jgi:hypothetical protein